MTILHAVVYILASLFVSVYHPETYSLRLLAQTKHFNGVPPRTASRQSYTSHIRTHESHLRITNLLYTDLLNLCNRIRNMRNSSRFIPPFHHSAFDPLLLLDGFGEGRSIFEVFGRGV